ncbi:phage tail tape measure protein [Pseudotamlana agarivorans]|uniref:phage tail tape measure protein n=1 Tax=Pseudotamlana agarivorans TaxID=481183 RepID=UPI00082A8524|nr:phage tail tape measure protein [Tamlana agarivorans]
MPIVSGDNSLYFATGIDTKGLESDSKDVVNIVQSLSSSIAKINPFAALAVGATVAFSKIAADAYQLAKGFENAMKEVETISEATQKNFKGISDQVFNLSRISPDGPEKLAKAYYQIVSAGYDGAKGLKLLETATKAATAGVTDTITAADGITTVLNAFKLDAEEAENVADILFKTVQLGKTTFSELASSMSTVAPIAASANIDFNQVSAAIATLTKQGVPTAQAMTQIRAAIVGVNKVLGDGWSETLTLQEAFGVLSDEANGSQVELQKMVGTIEAVGAILGTTGKNAKGAAEDLKAVSNATGAASDATDRMLSSNTNQLQILQNRIKASTKGIGEVVLTMSNTIAKGLNKALEEGNKLEKSYNQQREELFRLRIALQSVNEDSAERAKIVREIINSYPDYLKGIDSETVSNEQLLTVLDQINNAYKLRYKYEKRQNELREALNLQGDIEFSIENSQTKFDKHLARLQVIAKDRGITFDLNYEESDTNILAAVKEQLQGVEGAFDQVLNSGDKVKNTIKGFAQESVNNLESQVNAQFGLNKQLQVQSDIVQELTQRNEKLNTAQWNNANNQVEALKRIREASDVSELLEFSNSTLKVVQDAYKARKDVLEQLTNIGSINDSEGLASYLESENEEIRKAAEKRKAILEFKPNIKPENDLKSENDTYQDILDSRRKQYEGYQNYIDQLGKEAADAEYKTLLKQGDNFAEFLRNQLDKFKDNEAKKKQIINTAASSDVDLIPKTPLDLSAIEAIEEKINLIREEIEKPIFLPEFNLEKIADDRNDKLKKADEIRKLQLEKLSKYTQELDEKTIKKRAQSINKEYEKQKKDILADTATLLKNIPEDVLDSALLKTDLNFQNLNAATLGQLSQIEDKIQQIALDSKELIELGFDESQVNQLLEVFDELKNNNLAKINTQEAQKIGDYFYEVGSVMSQAGDDITAAVGNMAVQLGNAIAVMGDSSAGSLEKASGLVGLIIQAGGLMQEIGTQDFNKELNAQKQNNIALADQLSMEAKINEIRRERLDIEKNSSAFLDSYYKTDFSDALQRQFESEKQLVKTMETLSKEGIFSAEGVGDRLLFGTKTENRDFSIEDILGDVFIPDFFTTDPFKDGNVAASRFFDPLSIFGGYSDLNVSQDALKKLQKSFESTLSAMGKTSADMANFSTEEWLDFFVVMDEAGHITDEGTRRMLENAKEALNEYNDAVDEMKNIISDFAGQLGDDLSDALVSAFQEGGDAAENFMSSLNDVMNRLFLEELKNSFFKQYFDDLQEDMAASFENGGDQSWIDDIQRFSEAINPAINPAIEAMEAFNKEMKALGFEGFESSESTPAGLQGAIRRELTEETGSELTGLFRAQHDITKYHFELAQQQLGIMRQDFSVQQSIEVNTANTVVELIRISAKLDVISINTTPDQTSRDLGLGGG